MNPSSTSLVVCHKRVKLSPFCRYIKDASVSRPAKVTAFGSDEIFGDQHPLLQHLV